ncbi:MAG: aldose 1-epimerase [Acetobacteraceae bacterium]
MHETSLILRAGALELELAPAVGGAIAGFSHAGFALMRETPEATTNVRLHACYPLVPFSNRIAGGHFTFAGKAYQLRRDPVTGGAHAIHGEGWQRTWSVAEASRFSARLVLEHPGTEPGCWPFPFRAEQRFMLGETELMITLVITNTGTIPEPLGFGLHPYFPRHDGVALGFRSDAVWRNGRDHLPSERVALPPEWDFSKRRGLEEPGLDNCYVGWSGTAEISWPVAGRSLRISADRRFGHAVVFTPRGSDWFAFEPVSHMNDAVNRMEIPGHGLVILAPGDAIRGSVRLALTHMQSG